MGHGKVETMAQPGPQRLAGFGRKVVVVQREADEPLEVRGGGQGQGALVLDEVAQRLR